MARIKSGAIRPNNRLAPKSLRDLDPDELDELDLGTFEDVKEKLPVKKRDLPPHKRH